MNGLCAIRKSSVEKNDQREATASLYNGGKEAKGRKANLNLFQVVISLVQLRSPLVGGWSVNRNGSRA